MKKYWKLIVLFIFSLSTLCIYYIQYSSATNFLPKFSIEGMEGDLEASKPFIIDGWIEQSMMDGESFKVSTDQGTEYLSDESFFDRLDGYFITEKGKARKEKYYSFMRGKEPLDEYYFEDEQYLAYANTKSSMFSFDNTEFEIDVLNKKTNERRHFRVPIPDVGTFWYVELNAVKMIDEQLVIFTQNNGANEMDDHTDVYTYTIDLEDKVIQDSQVIYSYKENYETDGYTELNIIFNQDGSNQDVMVVQQFTEYEEEENGTEIQSFQVRDVVLYDLNANEQKDIAVPEDIGNLVTYTDDWIYTGNLSENSYVLKKYDRKQAEFTDELTINLGDTVEVYKDVFPQTEIQDGKLYFAGFTYGNQADTIISVIDLNGMESDFLGKVTKDNAVGKQFPNNMDYYLNDFVLR